MIQGQKKGETGLPPASPFQPAHNVSNPQQNTGTRADLATASSIPYLTSISNDLAPFAAELSRMGSDIAVIQSQIEIILKQLGMTVAGGEAGPIPEDVLDAVFDQLSTLAERQDALENWTHQCNKVLNSHNDRISKISEQVQQLSAMPAPTQILNSVNMAQNGIQAIFQVVNEVKSASSLALTSDDYDNIADGLRLLKNRQDEILKRQSRTEKIVYVVAGSAVITTLATLALLLLRLGVG